jgi:hypothetical protein
MGITTYDLKTCAVVAIAGILLIMFEIIHFMYFHNQGLQARIIVWTMTLCCFYNQGFLTRVAMTRLTVQEERESEC